MGDKTGIQWTDATLNPIVGCSIVSPACTNCYAMEMAARIVKMEAARGRETHYADTTREVNGKSVWTGILKQAPEHILLAPLRWKKPRRIFVNSMSDLFHESVPEKWIDEVFAVAALCPQHTFQVLTKRPKRMREYMTTPHRKRVIAERVMCVSEALARTFGCKARIKLDHFSECFKGDGPFSNVWLGVTAERQKEWDERTEHLRQTPAAVRFVSIEPMLEEIDMGLMRSAYGFPQHIDTKGNAHGLPHWLHQVICGGESGPRARPMHPYWVRSLRDQCAAAGIAFLLKQWGEWKPICEMGEGEINAAYHPAPEDFPEATRRPRFARCVLHNDAERFDDVAARGAFSAGKNGMLMIRVGKSHAGRLLDGKEHNEFPEARS